MQLRRFTADSTPAALGAVRMAFGDDAIILANRRLGDQVEIIATGNAEDASSLDQFMAEEVMAANSTGETDSAAGAALMADDPAPCTSISELSAEIDSVSVDAPALSLRVPGALQPDNVALSGAAAQSATDPGNDDPSPTRSESAADEHAQTAAQPIAAIPPASVEPGATTQSSALVSGTAVMVADDSASRQALSQILQAIEAQRLSFDKRFRGLEINLWGAHSPARSMHLRRLFALGIGAELAVRLVERVEDTVAVDDAVRLSLAVLKSTLPVARDKSLHEPGITVFCGPPGGGKTTAMIKLATQHVKQSGNQSIIIIGADTRRIGAFEELQAYGKLLGVQTALAHDTSELESLLATFSHKELILIDHGLPDGDRGIELPASLLAPQNDAVRHLFVMPATLQAVNAEALISRHCSGRRMHCVLTHLDSNARLGELFNSIVRHHLPVAYWSDSQSVQTPLERADASVLVATAVAMSRRTPVSADDDWLQRLIQPPHQLLGESVVGVTTAWSQNS
ncbi:MAG: hypothetical protein HKN42_03005 [Granulosicoccus sp.]|nr:hypothetical protein [Granulosicoccus sp.]